MVKTISFRLIYLVLGFINIKLFLFVLDEHSYGHYAWIIAFSSLGSILSFFGTNNEIFRLVSLGKKISIFQYKTTAMITIASSIIFVTVSYLVGSDHLYFASLYLFVFLIAKILVIPARVKANVLLVDFLNVGLFPFCLSLSLLAFKFNGYSLVEELFYIHLVFASLVLVVVFFVFHYVGYFQDFIPGGAGGGGYLTNAIHLWMSSISSLTLGVLDVFILGIFVSPDVLASYAFVSRISAITAIPLGFLVARYQPKIIGDSICSVESVSIYKALSVLFVITTAIAFYLFQGVISKYFQGVDDFLDFFYFFSIMYIVRIIFFEKVIKVQFVTGIGYFAWYGVVNTLVLAVFGYILALKQMIYPFVFIVLLVQVSPAIFSIIYEEARKAGHK